MQFKTKGFKMKISKILKTAMLERNIKNATELAKLSGVKYSTTIRALNDGNVGIVAVVDLLDHMGYELGVTIKGDV